MKKLVLASLMCCMAAMSSYADGIHFGTALDSTDYIIPAPRANWYIGAGGGVQTFIGNEIVSSARGFNGIDPHAYIEVGKWVLPDLALSLNVAGFKAAGQTVYGLNPYVDFAKQTPNANGYYNFDFWGITSNAYVTLDLTNFFLGFDRGEQKMWHIMVPLGMGFAWGTGERQNFKNADWMPSNFELSFSGGIQNEFRVTPRFSIVNDIKYIAERGSVDFSPYINHHEAKHARADWMPMVTLGVRYDVSGKEASRSKDGYAAVPVGVNRYFANVEGYRGDIKGLQDENDELRKELGELQGLIDELKNRPAEVQYIEKAAEPEPVVVYFKIDHWDLLPEAITILRGYAEVINNSKPEEKFYLIGGADSATGTPKRNVLLSNNRSRVVYDYLTKECGVDPNKLEKRALGGILEFMPIEMNRMTIVAPKTHRMCTIIDKWANETDNDIKK